MTKLLQYILRVNFYSMLLSALRYDYESRIISMQIINFGGKKLELYVCIYMLCVCTSMLEITCYGTHYIALCYGT